MCILDDYLLENDLSLKSVRNHVDDYSIYSHYIGEELEIGKAYSSPLRTDDHPSFSLLETEDGTILFKDHAENLKGDVYKFLMNLYNISLKQVLEMINIDFNLGLGGVEKKLDFKPIKKVTVKKKSKAKINITATDYYPQSFINYFRRYDIQKPVLQMYNVKNVSIVHYKYPGYTTHYFPKSLCIAYQIGKYFKIYQPFLDKSEKFRNDFPTTYVEGFLQLKYHKSFIIITKAMKEVMFFRQHFDIDSVAGKSETTMIPDFIMQKLFQNYKHVLIWLDRDSGGQKATKAYLEKYPNLIPVNYSSDIEQKDVTDRYFYLKELQQEKIAIQEITTILNKFYNENN